MENEIWKDIPGYDGYYQVSNFGRVKSLRKVLKAGLRKGYLYISLRNKKFNIHRLVAIAFIPNPGNLPETDHIDGNPLNNNVDNLRWVTRQQNELNPITRKRIFDSLKGRKVTWGDKVSKTLLGRKQSKETIEKRANSLRGRKRPRWIIEKLILANKGRKISDETRIKMGNAHKGKFGILHPRSQRVQMCNDDGVCIAEFNGLSEASRKTGILITSISNNIKGISKKAGGYIWKKI